MPEQSMELLRYNTCFLARRARRVSSSSSRQRRAARLVVTPVRQQRPRNAGVLVRERHDDDVFRTSGEQSLQPIIGALGVALDLRDHRTRAMDVERSKVTIAALADAQQRRLAAGGMLLGHDPQPRRQLPATGEAIVVAGASDRGARGEHANARNGSESAARLVVTMPVLNLALQRRHLVLQFRKMLAQPLQQVAKHARQAVLAIFENLRQAFGNVRHTLRDDDTEFAKQPPNLICLSRARLPQAVRSEEHTSELQS